ncbi:pentapeptide repeat-containing protein [Streptomyces luteogriseus]|uniref:pentapeptide repeat-containing protein n=1 Tax=Streptomyces luteogriseus TaxID=68233 RepID=UPI0037A007AC
MEERLWYAFRALNRFQARRFERRMMTKLERRQLRTRRLIRLRRRSTIALISVGTLVLLTGLPWLIWQGPYVLDAGYLDRKALASGSATLVTGLRTAIVAFVAALGATITVLYTARTYRLTRHGQITDRWTKNLERLNSSPDIDVRIASIHELEQIAQDAPEQTATNTARALGRFIRRQAPEVAPEPGPAPRLDVIPLPHRPEADVQAALTALARTKLRIHVDPSETLDLRGLHLAGADLRQANLTKAKLAGSTLTKADLSAAVLTRADLSGAMLTEVNLQEALLNEASLGGADLTRAFMAGAILTDARLPRATLTHATLRMATLARTDLTEATLEYVDVFLASVTEINVKGADFGDLRHAIGCSEFLGSRLELAKGIDE